MKVLINSDDAAFLRHVLESIQRLFPFNREQRRKLNRLHGKLAASKFLWGTGNCTMKTKELHTLAGIVARTIGNLEKEIANLTGTANAPELVEGAPASSAVIDEQKQERLAQLGLYVEYAKSVADKLADTLEQDVDAEIYISQSAHKEAYGQESEKGGEETQAEAVEPPVVAKAAAGV